MAITLGELRAKAEQGDAQAQRNLGLCYAQGKGVQQDHAQAVVWFQKAADQGDAHALCNLGSCYTQGKGVPKDLDHALVWYGQAAESSNQEAVKIANTELAKIGKQVADAELAKIKDQTKAWRTPSSKISRNLAVPRGLLVACGICLAFFTGLVVGIYGCQRQNVNTELLQDTDPKNIMNGNVVLPQIARKKSNDPPESKNIETMQNVSTEPQQTYVANSPEDIVAKYLNAQKWEERLSYVVNPHLVKPLMSQFYKDHFQGPTQYIEIRPAEYLKNTKKRVAFVSVVLDRGKNLFGATLEDTYSYILLQQEGNFQIDWECSVVYNPMKIIAYKVQQPTSVMKFRLYAKLDDYYNYQFRELKEQYYSVRLTEYKTNESIHGYIKRDSNDGKKMYEILKDGQEYPVMVNLRYLPNSPNGDVVLIDNFVQASWRGIK